MKLNLTKRQKKSKTFLYFLPLGVLAYYGISLLQGCAQLTEHRLLQWPADNNIGVSYQCYNSKEAVGEVCCTGEANGCYAKLCKKEDTEFYVVSFRCDE